MKPLGYAPAAIADLREIARFIGEDDEDRAETFVDELRQRALVAGASPTRFRERRDLSPGLRAIGHGRYLIFYRDLPHEVRIVRIIHGARDLSTIFKS